MTESADTEAELVRLVDAFARRICPAVLEQHAQNSVCSALGIWLLLAACAAVPSREDRAELEEALGCSSAEATDLLARFWESPPRALRAAMALWMRSADRSTPVVEWSASLPAAIERGPTPSQQEADAWVTRQTGGLITCFPVEVTPLDRLVLVSALATKVSWAEYFCLEPAPVYLRQSSPWQRQVTQVLVDYVPSPFTMVATTEAAGVVAAHFALGAEDLGVLSVAAGPTIPRQQVFEAAHELARQFRNDTVSAARVSLFDLPVGDGDSWQIAEEEIPAREEGWHEERIEYTVLPTWRSESELDLTASTLFGAEPALAALLALIGSSPEGDIPKAAQSAVASFTPTGFEAGVASALGIELGDTGWQTPTHRGLRRRGRLYFDHPYAAIALAGTASDFRRTRAGHSDSFCLPIFSAWIETPVQPERSS